MTPEDGRQIVDFISARVDEDSAGARSDRMRREVHAKRRLIDLHTYSSTGTRKAIDPVQWATMQILAAIYDTHPDYRPEWAIG